MSPRYVSTIVDEQPPTASTVATILIVDDEAVGRELLAALLEPQGYQLRFASNGPDALAQAAAQPPDLILLDVMMPVMDGFEVCRRLRADVLLREVPVVMLTALDDRVSRLRAIEAGVDDFIPKPFDRVELRARVRTITRLNRYRHLLAERAKFARVVELAPDGMLILNGEGAIVLANPAMLHLLGASQETDMLGRRLETFVVPELRDECRERVRVVAAEAAAVVRFESVLIHLDKTRLPVEMHAGSFAWDGQPAVQIIARDIGERKRAELLEEERHQIAYELHDGLAQFVTSAHQHLQAYAGHHRPRRAQARQALDQALDLARRSVQEVRRVIGGLRPTALDDFGLAAALQMYVDSLRADGWEIDYHQTLGEGRLPPAVETVIFRVALEALTNVRKHAGPTRARLELRRVGPNLRLEVQDWGRGFDPEASRGGAGLGERIGLRGMRERIGLLGGQWSIESRPGEGTRILAIVPAPLIGEGEAKHDD
jgi:PAS domain S-box-containing protein